MMHKLTLWTYLIKSFLKKPSIISKYSASISPQEIVICLPLAIFFDKNLYLKFQILGLPKIFGKIFMT